MTDPTPTQARLLRALLEYPYVRVAWNDRGCQLIGPKYWEVEKQLKREGVRLRASSLRAVTREGWLEPEEEGSCFYVLSEAGKQALSDLGEDDFISPVPSMTARDIRLALRDRYPEEEWWLLFEVTLSDFQDRRIDGLALQLHKPWHVHALEIKVDRRDFTRELDDPNKRLLAQQTAHRFYFVCPAGLISEHELPDGCGLLVAYSYGGVIESTTPPMTRSELRDRQTIASMARASMRGV